ncbi:MAG: hypothetical protein ACRCYX_04270 [Dermatophilaceae bacterium]
MIRVWLRAHHVVPALLLTLGGIVLMFAADSASFAAPRQPIPLVWPVATIQVSATLLVLDTGFGSLLAAATRALLDRLVAATTVVVLLAMLLGAAPLLGLPPLLSIWVAAVAGVGMGAALLGVREPWAAALVVGLFGIGLQFSTPLAPISRGLDRPAAASAVAALLGLTACGYVIQPLLIRTRTRRDEAE